MTVLRVGQESLDDVAVTVALSFADDPIWKWIYGSDETLPLETGIVLGRMLVAGMAPADEIHSTRDYLNGDHGAVALWTAPIGSTPPEGEELRAEQTGPHFAAFAEQLGQRVALTGQLSEAMKAHRPEQLHWYLGILGTHPDRQNQGLGSRVLTTMLAKADHVGIPTFLESSNPRNYGFYQRHGFVEQETLTVADSPPLLGFWRDAR